VGGRWRARGRAEKVRVSEILLNNQGLGGVLGRSRTDPLERKRNPSNVQRKVASSGANGRGTSIGVYPPSGGRAERNARAWEIIDVLRMLQERRPSTSWTTREKNEGMTIPAKEGVLWKGDRL